MRKEALVIIVLFLVSCSSKIPEDLYMCKENKDCSLVPKQLETKDPCGWNSINSQHVGWYRNETADYLSFVCQPIAPQKAVCVDGRCNMEPVVLQ
ncbi:MAG: hypothetical protein ABIH34_03280 [Nanoarchaeota archaeon]